MATTSQQQTLDDLQHNILLNEALLASLEGDDTEESDQDKITILEKLVELKRQLQSHVSIPNWSGTAKMDSRRCVDHRPSSSSSEDASALTPKSDTSSMAPPGFLALPSRKRARNDIDDGIDFPDSKSHRPSPALSAAPSPASTADSFDFGFDDDPVMQQILGANAKQEMRDNKQYLTELEKKRKQEKEDEEFARSLWEADNLAQSTAAPSHRVPTSNYAQATFLPDGSSYRTMAPPTAPPRPVKPEPPSYSSSAGLSSHVGPSPYGSSNPYGTPVTNSTPSPYARTPTPNAAGMPSTYRAPLPQARTSMQSAPPLTDNDNEIEEISSNDFSPNARQQRQRPIDNGYGSQPAGQSSHPQFAPNQTMPGAFPGAGFAGSSVYGGASPSDVFSLIDQQMAALGYDPMSGASGSARSAIDVDNYTARLQDLYSDPTKTLDELRELIKHIRPDEELSEREGTPEQIKYPLMEHQKLGLTWMKKMEEGTNKGGILADDMGLGKTIQALSLIVSRPPAPGAPKPTLVVAPVALMEQWKREVEKMVKSQFALRVFILHGDQRKTSWNLLKTQDIILTTYGQLASDLKRKLAWEDKLKMYPDARPTAAEYCPILGAQSKFHRVILDEAHWVKNKATKSAIGACHIQSSYRWCMTGTPMQNNVDELYSLIKFCRIRPYNEDTKFSRDFSRPLKGQSQEGKKEAMKRLQALLKAILLRRTKTSTIDGKPILTLPPKTTVEARAVFTEDERDFYKALEGKVQLQFNKYMKAGTIGRNYSNVLVLLLRLRQACCHPNLIKDFAIHTGTMEGIDLMENARSLPKDVVQRLRENGDAFECPVCLDAAENPVIFNPCGHALCNECLAQLVDNVVQKGDGAEPSCPHCRAKINTAKVTDHGSFLKVFDPENAPHEEASEDDEDDAGEDSDSSEDETDSESDDGEDLKDFIVDDDEEIELDEDDEADNEDEDTGPEGPFKKSAVGQAQASSNKKASATSQSSKKSKKGKKPRKGKGKGRDVDSHKSLAQLRREGLRNKAAKKKYLKRLKKDWHTSAKIEKTLELLEGIHARGTGEKTIIFSGFTSFLDLLEVPLYRHPDLSIYARYDGSMPPKSRNEAVLEFTGNPHCKIMLVSLKAGNAGLNLTAASQVIILDPHWNPFVEMQAADRAYRIGQMRPVEVHRVLIDGEGMDAREDGSATVEDRILALQEKKRELVESALDEAAGNGIARLDVRQLGYLFGVNSME